MGKFSSASCYAALCACSTSDTIEAYSRMIAALIQTKEYRVVDTNKICTDFERTYGFSIPLHPMQVILKKCCDLSYLSYQKLNRNYIPNYEVIEKENFIKIIEDNDKEYKTLLKGFKDYLADEYDIHSSDEDLSEKIGDFIEECGAHKLLDAEYNRKSKNTFLFADYLVYCEENNRTEVFDFLNKYSIGLSLSEIFVYSEKPEFEESINANVYIDTGLLFKILGLSIPGTEDTYKEFLREIRKKGMHIKIFEHTFNEAIGIIENACYWIGNTEFDLSKCSEVAYYFVSNGWTKQRVQELSGDLKRIVEKEHNIIIDKTIYPKADDIHTIYEQNIYDLIVEKYRASNPNFNIDDMKNTIQNDAKSIFLVNHLNSGMVAYHLNEVKNIFITSNFALSYIGHGISREQASSRDYFIPVVMTDVMWGTLIWLNSPVTISKINRAKLVSTAYAAFKPSQGVIERLNVSLKKLEDLGEITPEKCYFLKTSPVAHRLLSEQTLNDAEYFNETTVLEVLNLLEQEGFEKGKKQKQEELDAYKKQTINEKCDSIISQINDVKTNLENKERQRKMYENNVKKKMRIFNTFSFLLIVLIAVLAGIFYLKFNFIYTILAPIVAVFVFLAPKIFGDKWERINVSKKYEEYIRERLKETMVFSLEDIDMLNEKLEGLEKDLQNCENSAKEI